MHALVRLFLNLFNMRGFVTPSTPDDAPMSFLDERKPGDFEDLSPMARAYLSHFPDMPYPSNVYNDQLFSPEWEIPNEHSQTIPEEIRKYVETEDTFEPLPKPSKKKKHALSLESNDFILDDGQPMAFGTGRFAASNRSPYLSSVATFGRNTVCHYMPLIVTGVLVACIYYYFLSSTTETVTLVGSEWRREIYARYTMHVYC